jgi:long-chain fatty acid transport protein
MKKLCLLFSFLPLSSPLFTLTAGGFQIPQQSIKSMAFGGAFTGFCGDASTLFYNPAGMNNLTGQNFTAGIMGLFPYVSVQTPSTPNINQTSSVYTPIDFYWVGQFCNKLRIGMGINNQFGSAASYPNDWEGQYIVQSISLKTYMFQPTVSYQLCKMLSIGGGFVYTLGTFGDTKAIPVASSSVENGALVTTSNNGEVNINGTGHAFGYNFGIFSKLWQHGSDSSGHQCLQVGVSYRSGLPFTVPNGDVNFSQIPSSLATDFPASENFSTHVNMPAVFTAGFAFKFSCCSNWDFMVTYDFNYTFWSTYDSLHFNFTNPNTPSQGFVYNWKNAMAHRMGAEVTYKKKYTVRLGYYIDGTPVQNGYVSPEIVDANSSGFCFGAGVKFCKHYSVDISYLRSDFTWNNTTWNNPSGGTETTAGPDFSASYHRVINIFGIGVNYQF